MAEVTKKVNVATPSATAAKATTATTTAATAKKEAPAKKAAPAKKTAAKTTAKKTTTKKTTAKKAAVKEVAFVQFAGKSLDMNEVVAACKADFKENNKRKSVEEINVYINTDDSKAYYVVKSAGNDFTGDVVL